MSQSRSDPADVLQGVVTYIYLTGFLFVFSLLGEELSTDVSTFGHINFSFIFIVFHTAIQVLHFSFNICLVA
jgi:hypothetical protein